jgi:hypothetical protein
VEFAAEDEERFAVDHELGGFAVALEVGGRWSGGKCEDGSEEQAARYKEIEAGESGNVHGHRGIKSNR